MAIISACGPGLLGMAMLVDASLSARITAGTLGIGALCTGSLLWRRFSQRLALVTDVMTARPGEVIRVQPKVAVLRHVTVGGMGAVLRDKTFCSANYHLVLRDGSEAVLRVANLSPEEFQEVRDALSALFPGAHWEADQRM